MKLTSVKIMAVKGSYKRCCVEKAVWMKCKVCGDRGYVGQAFAQGMREALGDAAAEIVNMF